MKIIHLTQGKTTQVDDDIYEAIGHLKWTLAQDGPRFYAYCSYAKDPQGIRGKHSAVKGSGGRVQIRLHQVVMGRPLNGFVIDHIDRNGLNNLRSNLRIVTHRGNMSNCFYREKRKTSKFVGVHRQSDNDCWTSQIRYGGRTRHLGCFNSEEAAHRAYQSALSKIPH